MLDPVAFEFGRLENDIIGLPLTWFTAGIYKGWKLAVYGSRRAIGVGGVLVAIEHLYFVESEKENPAVATALTVALDSCRGVHSTCNWQLPK